MIRRPPILPPYSHTLSLHYALPILLRRLRWPSASPRGGFRSPTSTPSWKPASSVCACSEQHFPWRARKSSATQFEIAAYPLKIKAPQEPQPLVCRQTLRCRIARSEEHTSELQSLMRISYAVFCLKKKIIL